MLLRKNFNLYYLLLIFVFFLVSCQQKQTPDGESQYQSFSPDGIPFVIADSAWTADMQGNHRAVVSVDLSKVKNAVQVDLPWRRADLRPESKMIIVVDALTGKNIRNVKVLSFSSEKGIIAFEPNPSSSKYYVYYLPYRYREGWDDARYGKPWNDYLKPEYKADANWLNSLSADLPKAKVELFESRTRFDFFTSMGVTATRSEMNSLLQLEKEVPVLFMEDRAYPIRLTYQIPVRWIKTGSSDSFTGEALKNEYYTWQVGVWAAKKELHHVKLQFSDLKNGSEVIPQSEITCFNQEGINWNGEPIKFDVNIPENRVQALWCGVQIPENAKSGKYTGEILLAADELSAPRKMTVTIDVKSKVLADKGDGETWRHARLRWLNSRIGIDNEFVAPYKEMTVNGNKVEATGKTLTLDGNGLPKSIRINDREVFAAPLSFIVETNQGNVVFEAENVKVEKKASGLVAWQASSEQKNISFNCSAYMEYDGYIRYNVKAKSNSDVVVKNVRLSSKYTPEASEYFMGAGFSGGYRPAQYKWDWIGPYDSYWIGGVKAGLHVEFRGGSYHGPLIADYKPEPPVNWANHKKGHLNVSGGKNSVASVDANTGEIDLTRGRDFEFALLITPVREIDTKQHFSMRFFHGLPTNETVDKAAEDGATIVNIHHASRVNPYINYPFIVRDSLKQYINHNHENGRKVKLYYTIRELTTFVTELHALKSLNHEIFPAGVGYGVPWLCEHLIDDYKPAWYTDLNKLGLPADAALVLSPFSRWINYYLEGLRWMFENYQLDGIYMDDVSFDRNVMKRMRKIMAKYRPGALIDLHSNTGYSRGPMNQYTDFFPYVDRLWFGESFQYNKMRPDEWFVTFSGIPFGRMSEMLHFDGNRFLGMVYGTTRRYDSESNPTSPVPVWKLWIKFGIEDSKMLGYWNPENPITINSDLVKSTTYLKDDKLLISVGNFDTKEQTVKLNIDWKKLGWNKNEVKGYLPEIKNFQMAQDFDLEKPFMVKPKEGLLIIMEKE